MPRVPQAENTVRATINPSVRSNAGITQEAYGAGIGRGLQQLGGAVVDIALQERQKQDTAVIMGAERQLQEWENRALFTPESGAYAQKGSASFGLIDRVMPEYDKTYSEIESTLNGRQKVLFQQRTGGKRSDIERGLMRHTGQEAEVYQKSETAALVQTRLNTASLYTADPARFDAEVREAQGAFLAGNPGLPPAAQKVGLTEIESKARTMAVEKLLRDDPMAAQRYFNQYRDTFTADDGQRLEALLDPSVDQAAGEAVARTALAGGSISPNRVPNGEVASAIKGGAEELGIDPVVLATVISYETGGTFDPDKRGPTTKWGQHRGLIQFGEPQRAKYGVRDGMTVAEQMPAVVAYLRDHGVRPGMSLMDVYSAINAGAPGRYNASDEAAGGAPGTVADKVNNQMSGHRAKAEAMFAGDGSQASSPESAAAAIPKPRTYAEALEQVSNLPPGRTRDAAINYLQTQDAIEKRREAEADKAMLESISTKIEQASPTTPFNQIVTPSELAWAQSTGRVSAYEARLKQRIEGTDIDTPPDVLLAYRDVAARAFAGDKTAQRELLSYKPYDPKQKMSMSDRDWLAKQQETLRNGSPEQKAKGATEGEINAIIKQYTVTNLGVPEKAIGTSTEKGQRAWKFYNDLRSWAEQYEQKNGKPPSYQDVQQRADDMTLVFTREEPGLIYGTNKVESNVFDLDIPPATLTEITTLLRTNGLPVTGANVAQVYKNMLKRNAAQ